MCADADLLKLGAGEASGPQEIRIDWEVCKFPFLYILSEKGRFSKREEFVCETSQFVTSVRET